MNKIILHSICFITLMAGMMGCSSKRVTMHAWQGELDEFAATHADGDLIFLREDAGGGIGGDGAGSLRQQFGVLAAKSPDDSTDVMGVLLGRRNIQGEDWLVFLIGSVKQRIVQDIRVALRSDSPTQSKWLLGRADSASVAQYRRFKQDPWLSANPNQKQAPAALLGFPSEQDVYQLETAGNTVSVLESKSGARWTLVLPETKASRQAQATSPATVTNK